MILAAQNIIASALGAHPMLTRLLKPSRLVINAKSFGLSSCSCRAYPVDANSHYNTEGAVRSIELAAMRHVLLLVPIPAVCIIGRT